MESMNNLNPLTIQPNKRGRPPKDINSISGLKESFKAIFKFTGNLLSIGLKFNKFEIDDNESELLSDQADQVCFEFIPQVGTKYAKVVIFIISLFSIFGKKYLEFILFKQNVNKEMKKAEMKKRQDESEIITIRGN